MVERKGLTEAEQYKVALKLAMQFVDRCAGEGIFFRDDGTRPDADAADVCYAVADLIGIENLDSDAYRDLVTYPASRAALSERGGR